METVFIAGATGYLGRYLCAEFKRRGWVVHALVRDRAKALDLHADQLIEAEATRPETLNGVMNGASLVVSALGITRQADGLDYKDVDYQANINLLTEAQRAKVGRFAYIHVINAEQMEEVPLVAAKAAFVRALKAAPIPSTVIAPSGYFSDMSDFLNMAQNGRVWLFGTGTNRINPIHGADLAFATADAIAHETDWLDVGGPDIFTHNQLAQAAFTACNKSPKISHMPDMLRRVLIGLLPWVAPRRISGPARFFLTAMGTDMLGEPHGSRHLPNHFNQAMKSHVLSTRDMEERKNVS